MQAEARDRLDAGNANMNLRSLGEYYFTVGTEVARIRKDDELRKSLRRALSGARYEKIFDWSRSSSNADASGILETLTEEERGLFQAGFEARRAMHAWKSRQVTKLQTSEIFAAQTKQRAAVSGGSTL